jgi:predicted phosphodiesterase
MSDLHFEFHRDRGVSFLASVEPAGDVLVLAGDIMQARHRDDLEAILGDVAARWKHVVYVAGNHESYGYTYYHSMQNCEMVASEFPNVHFLNNMAVDIEGVRFFGGTGWFPNPQGNPISVNAKRFMNDFRMIVNLEPTIYGSNQAFRMNVGSPDVVVTHHLPTAACVAPKYAMSALNAFFVSDFDVEDIGAKLWLHGHTHEQVDMVIGQTRVVANPLGYPSEAASLMAFQEKLVIEI